jgi:hypothetical protein
MHCYMYHKTHFIPDTLVSINGLWKESEPGKTWKYKCPYPCLEGILWR